MSKVGENITDGTVNLSRSLWSILSRKAPDSQTARLIKAGQEIDYQQAVIDVEAIADDPDVVKLLDEVRSLLSSNQELAAKVEALQLQLSQSKSDNPNKLAEKIGIVVQSGGKADIQTLSM
ncbi:MAG: hypothetical protein DCF19_12240 [Pseudanabaena frigida]|uniref:Uncharacterized protein n=1 Tax=Pseudanabaena frigida TaxID=945775 RepID=A0A2W4YBX1_9CYAN|nr:MAG: hypothetical protein DCF19_12240 [Pseudanabaena frigida]